ncbi:hypothetical protein ABZX75_12195 [Streptomyces sp. NPDC003038]|uniref:hypothetical protein n=1 Tax=unclassified Streptomyces TaxID=2593676 RepID=UPI0033B9CA3E
MTARKTTTVLTLTALATGTALASASPASAGGIGDFLSPAFGTSCANHHATHAAGTTAHGTGAANGNLAGLPLGGALNQCGGADLPEVDLSKGAEGIAQFLPTTWKIRGVD